MNDDDLWDDECERLSIGDFARANGHPESCDCQGCRDEDALCECGQLPDSLGGGCQLAGTEFCGFECPIGRKK